MSVPLLEKTTVEPLVKGLAGIIPTFIISGTMTPGVFGPIILAPLFLAYPNTFDGINYRNMFWNCD